MATRTGAAIEVVVVEVPVVEARPEELAAEEEEADSAETDVRPEEVIIEMRHKPNNVLPYRLRGWEDLVLSFHLKFYFMLRIHSDVNFMLDSAVPGQYRIQQVQLMRIHFRAQLLK